MSSFGGFFKPSIYRRVLTGPAIVIALILLVSGASYLRLVQLRNTSEEAIPTSSQMVLLQDYALSLSALDADLERSFVIGGPEVQETTLQHFVEMEAVLDTLDANATDEFASDMAALRGSTFKLQTDTLSLFNMVARGASSRKINEQTLALYEEMDRASQLHRQLSEDTLQSLQANIQRQERVVASMTTQQAILALAAFAFAVGASLLVSRGLVAPIFDMVQTATQLAGGDYSQRTNVTSEDEIGRLGTAFNEMARAVQSREQDLQDLTDSLEQQVQDRTAELVVAYREAEEANRLKSEFLAVMSHELRTPLNAIIGFVGIMMLDKETRPQTLHMNKRVRANAERLLSLIDDILDISRIESGRLELVPGPLSLRETAESMRAEFGVLAEEKNLNFSIHVAEDLPETILIDEDALRKILTNLLANAVKFTDNGQVSIELTRQAHSMVIQVRDTGVGIPAHMQEVIFESFRQADSSYTRAHGGAGLGLSIVRHLCRAMNGMVEVSSAAGEGSTFTVRLPLEKAVEVAA